MDIKINWEENNLTVSFGGDIDIEDILNTSLELVGYVSFEELEYIIYDFSNVDKVTTYEDSALIVSVLNRVSSRWNENLKVAIVSSFPTLNRLLVEYHYRMSTSSWETKSFFILDEAKTWCIIKTETNHIHIH